MTTNFVQPRGIDVSEWQGDINWALVAQSGVQFAFIKATEGTSFVDRQLTSNWRNSKANGIIRGAYHYGHPENHAETEAGHFMATMQAQAPLEPGDLLALDLEEGTGDLSAWTLAFLRTVEMLAGFKPLFYSTSSFIVDHQIRNEPEIGNYGLWIASWGVPSPWVPSPWEFWACHQYTDSLIVPGISDTVDGDYFNLSVDRIHLYGMSGTPPPPPVKPPTSYEELANLVGLAYHDDGNVIPALEAALNQNKKNDVKQAVQAVIDFLRTNNPDR